MNTPHGKIIVYFLSAQPWLWGGILLVLGVASLLEGLNVAAFFPVFQSLLQPSGAPAGSSGGLFQALTGVSAWLPFKNPVAASAVLLIGVTGLKCVVLLLREGLVAYASGSVQHSVKDRLMRCYSDSSYLFLLEQKQGQLAYEALTATGRVGVLVLKIPQFLADLLKITAIGVLLLLAIPAATLGLAAFVAGYYSLMHLLSARVSYHTGKGRAVAGAEQTAILSEFLTGTRQIFVFGTSASWLSRFRRHSRSFRDLYIRDNIWLAAPRIVMEAAVVLLIFGSVALSQAANSSFLTDHLAVAGVFTMAIFQLFPAVASIGRTRMEISNFMADAELVHRALTRHRPRFLGGGRPARGLSQAIRFDQVRFAYPGRPAILNGLSVAFEKTQVTAVVGPSGSGKTTVVNLLLGLLEPSEGRILVDGVDLREYSLESWHRRIGFVSQDPLLIHASVADNISFGRTGFSPEAIRKAAARAHAHEFIAELPQGYDTLVGERGMKLSGGQQQRIAIARAILHEPEILIFDEATSSLDTISERLVQSAMEKLSHDRTVILIAHRLSTVRHADKIVVLEEGKILEEGDHDKLLGQQGRYFQLVTSSLHPAGEGA